MRDIEARVARDIGGPLPAVASFKEERAGSSTFGELFKPPYLGRTVMMSTFNLLSVVGYYGFAAWVPTLLIDKGITVTTSLLYAFIIAIANPVGPLLGFPGRRPDGAQMADRVVGGRHRHLHAAVCAADQPGHHHRARHHGDAVEQLAFLHLPQLPGRAVPDAGPRPRGRLCLCVGQGERGLCRAFDRLLLQQGRHHRRGAVHRRRPPWC